MLENAIYSVISPEGCASILYKDASKAAEAAESLKLTARDALEPGVVERVLPESGLGSEEFYATLGGELKEKLDSLAMLSSDERGAALIAVSVSWDARKRDRIYFDRINTTLRRTDYEPGCHYGLGAITPLGCDVAALWGGAGVGKCGIDSITKFDTCDHKAKARRRGEGF